MSAVFYEKHKNTKMLSVGRTEEFLKLILVVHKH